MKNKLLNLCVKMSDCGHCNKIFGATAHIVICKKCTKEFHGTCLGVNKTLFNSVQQSSNAFLLCNDCTLLFENFVSGSTELHDKTSSEASVVVDNSYLERLELQIRKNHEMIEKIGAHILNKESAVLMNDNASSQQQQTVPSKSYSNVVIGNAVISNDDDVKILAVEPKKWLFVSRIDTSTDDVTFKNFVSKNLGIADAVCIRMVPKLRDNIQPSYISYKIGISSADFDGLLEPSCWPSGLLVKEYQVRYRRPANFPPVSTLRSKK